MKNFKILYLNLFARVFPNKAVSTLGQAGLCLTSPLELTEPGRQGPRAVLLELAWEHLENFPKIGPGWM